MADKNQVETLAEGLTLEFIADGQIAVFTISNIHQVTIDVWIEATKEILLSLCADCPSLFIHNFLPTKVNSLTPYIRTKGKELMKVRPELSGRTAFVIHETFVVKIVRLYLHQMASGAKRKREIFFTTESALAWVSEAL